MTYDVDKALNKTKSFKEYGGLVEDLVSKTALELEKKNDEIKNHYDKKFEELTKHNQSLYTDHYKILKDSMDKAFNLLEAETKRPDGGDKELKKMYADYCLNSVQKIEILISQAKNENNEKEIKLTKDKKDDQKRVTKMVILKTWGPLIAKAVVGAGVAALTVIASKNVVNTQVNKTLIK